MSIATTTTLANAIKDHYAPSFYEGVYRNDAVLGALRAIGVQEITQVGGNTYKWHINSAGNTSTAVFTENSAAPEAVGQTWVRPSVSFVYYWSYVQITGMARDALKDGGIFGALEAEMSLAMRDIVDLRSTTMLGSTNNGLQHAISASSTYAGITRGSAAYFESSTSSTATVAGLRAMYMAMRAPDKGGKLTASFVSPTVMDWYVGLVGLPATQTNSTLRYVAPADGSPAAFDLGYRGSSMGFMGAPVIEIPDLTSSVWIMLDTTANNIKHIITRPFDVKFHHNAGDNEIYQISTGSTLVIEMPKWQAIMTSIS